MPGTFKELFLAILSSKIENPANAIASTLSTAAFSKLTLTDGIAAPTAISGVAQIYVDVADGDLKVRFGDNVTKTLATDV